MRSAGLSVRLRFFFDVPRSWPVSCDGSSPSPAPAFEPDEFGGAELPPLPCAAPEVGRSCCLSPRALPPLDAAPDAPVAPAVVLAVLDESSLSPLPHAVAKAATATNSVAPHLPLNRIIPTAFEFPTKAQALLHQKDERRPKAAFAFRLNEPRLKFRRGP